MAGHRNVEGEVRVSVAEHRPQVVDRLLGAGVAPRVITALIPEWEDLVSRRVSAGMSDRSPVGVRSLPRVRDVA